MPRPHGHFEMQEHSRATACTPTHKTALNYEGSLSVFGPVLLVHMHGDVCEGVKSRIFACFCTTPLPACCLPDSQRMWVDTL